MQSENKIFDDLAKILNGVAGTVAGMGREAQENFKERSRDWVGGLDMVSREEFEAVKQLAANARAEADSLAQRVAKLEAAVDGNGKPAPTANAPKNAAKAAAAKPKSASKSAKT
ncbi:MAG: accessory factor UbiK family protein [Sphingorhabdus sp.]|nr:accessory factor UbiK family protein [Sphingorhabdus sp.]